MMAVVGAADVGGEEEGLEADEGGFVDLAGEGDDGGDGFGEGLAGAGDRLLHAVEEAAFSCGPDADDSGWSGVRVCRVCRRG